MNIKVIVLFLKYFIIICIELTKKKTQLINKTNI